MQLRPDNEAETDVIYLCLYLPFEEKKRNK